jgi:uncharacterized damage-inducible protein DinB
MMSLTNAAEEVRFPVGVFLIDPAVTDEKRRRWIAEMAQAPANLRVALTGLSDDQLDTHYREGGWTLRQVAHHLADAHINGFVRFKLALTEDNPPIKTYEETLWADTVDGREAPVESLCESDLAKSFSHPQRGVMTIDKAIQLYAWHGVHHTAHITGLRERKGW